MELNVTFYNPVITIVVERERMVSEVIYQPETEYVKDPSMAAGYANVVQEGWDGSKDVVYREVYVNGKLTSYKQVSSVVTKEAQGKRITHQQIPWKKWDCMCLWERSRKKVTKSGTGENGRHKNHFSPRYYS